MKTKILIIILAIAGFIKKTEAQVHYNYYNQPNSNGWSLSDGQPNLYNAAYPMYLSTDEIPCGNFYSNDYLQLKRFASRVLVNNASLIRNAISYFSFNNFVQDYLYSAVSHQRYAKQLYRMGFYEESIGHSNHAAYIVNSLFDFMTPGGAFCEADFYTPDGMRKGNPSERGAERKMNGERSKDIKPNLPSEFERSIKNMDKKLPAEFRSNGVKAKPNDMLNLIMK